MERTKMVSDPEEVGTGPRHKGSCNHELSVCLGLLSISPRALKRRGCKGTAGRAGKKDCRHQATREDTDMQVKIQVWGARVSTEQGEGLEEKTS